VSLSQIADLADLNRVNVARSLRVLEAKKLAGHEPGKGQAVLRWVVWPLPPPPAVITGDTSITGATGIKAGITGDSRTGITGDSRTGIKAGITGDTHQDTKNVQEVKDTKNLPPDKPAGDVSASPKEPAAGKTKKAGKTRADPKPREPNLFAEAFKAAFDETFPEVGGYAWHKADFIQLARWREAHPGVDPERFVEVAQWHWGRGQYAPGAAKTIRGLCSNWEALASAAGDGDGVGKSLGERFAEIQAADAAAAAAKNERKTNEPF